MDATTAAANISRFILASCIRTCSFTAGIVPALFLHLAPNY